MCLEIPTLMQDFKACKWWAQVYLNMYCSTHYYELGISVTKGKVMLTENPRSWLLSQHISIDVWIGKEMVCHLLLPFVLWMLIYIFFLIRLVSFLMFYFCHAPLTRTCFLFPCKFPLHRKCGALGKPKLVKRAPPTSWQGDRFPRTSTAPDTIHPSIVQHTKSFR